MGTQIQDAGAGRRPTYGGYPGNVDHLTLSAARRDPRHPPRVPRRGRRLRHHELVPVDAPAARGVGAGRRRRSSTTAPRPRLARDDVRRVRDRRLRRASWPARSARPACCRRATTRRCRRSRTPSWSSCSASRPSALLAGRRRPAADRDDAGHPRDARGRAPAPGARSPRPAGRVPLQVAGRASTSPGRMLLGTDIGAVAAILRGMKCDIIGTNCSVGPRAPARAGALPARRSATCPSR